MGNSSWRAEELSSMTNITDLNINYSGKPVAGFTGSSAAFDELERLAGGALPAAYVNFIRSSDGGHPEVGCFQVPGSEPENIVEVDWFYSVANPELESIRSALEGFGALLGPEALPIGRDGGGNQFYLLLNSQSPSVWLYLHDEGGKRIWLADCFEEFISGLVSNPDFI